MSLWVDKYRPSSLDKLELHTDITTIFKKLCEQDDFPHLLLFGPSGAGKKTRVTALLRELYGPGSEKVRLEHRTIQTATSKAAKAKELVTIASSYHIEMNPSDFGIHDRVVVTEVVKEIAQSKPLDTKRTFKVVVINDVDKLTKEAQHALRRTMELYVNNCRLILVGRSSSKVIEPLRSRCLSVRVPAPTVEQIESIMQTVARKENITLPSSLAQSIATKAERNLRRALLMFEATKIRQYPFLPDQMPELPAWEDYIVQIAKEMVEEQTPKQLVQIRRRLYDLLARSIPADVIFRTLVIELFKKIDDEAKIETAQWAAFYEHRLQLGSKAIYHLEAFVARFMSLYKQFLFKIEDTNN